MSDPVPDLPPKTREFLADLSPEDISTIKLGLPLIQQVAGDYLARLAVRNRHAVGSGLENPGWFKPPP